MKKLIYVSFAVLLSLLFVLSCTRVKKTENVPLTQEQTIKRGEYLITVMGCNDCHTPKTMGSAGPELIQAKLLSGYPAEQPVPFTTTEASIVNKGLAIFIPDLTAAYGPWGVSFAANLTPDPTGIGNWTIDNFRTALVKGKYKGFEASRTLLPPMPWQNFAIISEEDLGSMFAYLKSIPAISNTVPAPILPEEIK